MLEAAGNFGVGDTQNLTVAKTIYKWKPYAARLKGRPRVRWEDDGRNDLRKMGVTIRNKGRRRGSNGKK